MCVGVEFKSNSSFHLQEWVVRVKKTETHEGYVGNDDHCLRQNWKDKNTNVGCDAFFPSGCTDCAGIWLLVFQSLSELDNVSYLTEHVTQTDLNISSDSSFELLML